MRRKFKRVFGLDTETFLHKRETRPFLVQVYTEDYNYASQHGVKKDGKWVFEKIWEVYREEEMNDFLRWLSSTNLRSSLFVTFNMAFDLTVLSKLGVKVEVLVSNSRFIFGKITRKKVNTYFIDLSNILLSRSLYEVGKKLGIAKLEHPIYFGTERMVREYESNPQYREYVRQYAITDAKIVYLAGKKILEEIGELKSTAGSTSVYYFTRNYFRFSFPNYPDEVKAKLKQAYRGGRTEVLVRGTIDEHVKYYDFNSLYPSVMYFERFPYIDNSGEGRFKKKTEIDLDKEGIALVQVRSEGEIPLLGIKRRVEDGFTKLVFPEGVLLDWFTYPELRTLEEKGMGKVERVLEAFEWRFYWNPFREFIEAMYRKRKELEDDKVKSTLYKLLMNSLYGKFGEYKGGERIIIEDGKVVKREPSGSMKHKYYHSLVYASYITAYGRIWLWKLMNSQSTRRFFYCDTDSVFTSHDLSHRVGKNLGDLKLEGEVKPMEATFIRSKFYIFGDLVRLKGFTLQLKGEDMKKLITAGAREIPQEKFIKPLEALRRKVSPLAYDVVRKTFSINPDYKRVYKEYLDREMLFRDYTYSEPRLVREGEFYAYS